MNNYKQLLTEFHKNNYNITYNQAFLNKALYTVLDGYKVIDDNLILNGYIPFGLYAINYKNYYLVFFLNDALYENEYIIICNERKFFIVKENNKVMYLPTYIATKFDLETNIMSNTVNHRLDMFCYAGQTTIKKRVPSAKISPSNLATFTSIDSSKIITYNDDETINDVNNIQFQGLLKNINNSYDLFYHDSSDGKSYIIYKIGRLMLTGNETFEKVEEYSNEKYSTFLLKYNPIKRQSGNINKNIICTHFEPVTFNSMKSDTSTFNLIAAAPDMNAIYIRIDNRIAKDGDVLVFKQFIRDEYKTDPITIDYVLDSPVIKTVSTLDAFVQTFYPNTKVECDEIERMILMCKTHNIVFATETINANDLEAPLETLLINTDEDTSTNMTALQSVISTVLGSVE